MQVTISQLKNWFNEFKGVVFDNDMPAVNFVITNTRTALGRAIRRGTQYTIKVTNFYDRTTTQFRNTLLHEMCHIWCYYKGYRDDHHTGYHWRQITDKAYRLTGLLITRTCSDTLVPAKHNEAKMQAIEAKKKAPALIVDFGYGSYHFLVKTTKKVIWDASDGKEIRGYSNARSKTVYVCDSPTFANWQSSRSLNRGYKYGNTDYANKIKPSLEKGIKVDNLREVCFWGELDSLGVR